MKKLILGSAIVAVLGVASNAMAAPNTGTVNFVGSVSSATCELSLKDSTGKDIANVNLGVLATSGQNSTPVTFKLVPPANAADCLNKNAANVSWSSPTLAAAGINNATTGGTNAYLKVAATNTTTAGDKMIKQGQTSFDYGKTASFDYSAMLTKPDAGNLTAGQFTASASYIVTYK